MTTKTKDAVRRALRTYIQVAGPAFLAIVAGADPFNLAAWKVAALSGVPALVAFAWRQWLDDSPVPSLTTPQ